MDTISPLTHSPASVSLPVSPDDDSRFDRTVSPSPACPKETLQQCGVSRIVEIHAPVVAGNTPTLLNFLEQASPLGYNTLNLTNGQPTLTGANPNPTHFHAPFLYPDPEQLTRSSHSLGYYNTLTTNNTQFTHRILRHLDQVTISIAGKPQTQEQRDAFANMQKNLTIVKNKINNFGFSHTLLPDSWKILSWLTDFAMHHKATHLHLHTNKNSTRSAIDLLRVYISHYYLKTFAEPELLIQLDLLHRDNLINNPNFFFHQTTIPKHNAEVLSKLIIDEKGDILLIPQSTFFKLGNIHDTTPLSTMIDQFMEKKLEYIMQLYNDTYREILADPGVEIFSWHQLIIDKSKKFEVTPHSQD